MVEKILYTCVNIGMMNIHNFFLLLVVGIYYYSLYIKNVLHSVFPQFWLVDVYFLLLMNLHILYITHNYYKGDIEFMRNILWTQLSNVIGGLGSIQFISKCLHNQMFEQNFNKPIGRLYDETFYDYARRLDVYDLRVSLTHLVLFIIMKSFV